MSHDAMNTERANEDNIVDTRIDLERTSVDGNSETAFKTDGSDEDFPSEDASSDVFPLKYLGVGPSSRNSELHLHACSYCGVRSPSTVVRCVTCNRWFCNGKGKDAYRSHIITHLVSRHHSSVELHKNSRLGNVTLTCYNCQTSNVFVLGSIQRDEEEERDIICRYPCMKKPQAQNLTLWRFFSWAPLISNGSIVPWLVAAPENVPENCNIPLSQMLELEEAWKKSNFRGPTDLNKFEAHATLRYQNKFKFQEVFAHLVSIESEYERVKCEALIFERIPVKWQYVDQEYFQLSFSESDIISSQVKINVGTEIEVFYETNIFGSSKVKGAISKIQLGSLNNVIVDLQYGISPPQNFTAPITLKIIWTNTSYIRMQEALFSFAFKRKPVSYYLHHKFLGHHVQDACVMIKDNLDDLFIPSIDKLNMSQKDAVMMALRSSMTLIQGPPGTGKTVVSTAIVYLLSKMTSKQILVCAPSNIAVDQLALRLSSTGLRVVKVTAKAREPFENEHIKHLSLSDLVKNDPKTSPDLLRLLHKKTSEELTAKEKFHLSDLLRYSEATILKKTEVVCCTCSTAGDRRLNSLKFKTVLIDESSQATEPGSLIPIVKGCTQLVLVGDQMQLGPCVQSRAAEKLGLGKSLFERMIELGHSPITLKVQYRMHPCLAEFPNQMFYENLLQNGVDEREREHPGINFPWPSSETPIMFWSTFGNEEKLANEVSYMNLKEAQRCERVVTRFLEQGISPTQIGIITTYQGQRIYLIQHMSKYGPMHENLYCQVEIESIDAFQGREKDYIILSCVRSNKSRDLGFLSDFRRLNVALTRAKYGLVLIGNPSVLSESAIWYHLLAYLRQKGCLMKGPLDLLVPSNVNIKKPCTKKGLLFQKNRKGKNFKTRSQKQI